jgi:predicted RND superfamily exporter protein
MCDLTTGTKNGGRSSIAALFLGLVAVFHLLRIIFQVPVTAGSAEIPMWASVLGVLGPGALAVWLWREQK